MLIMPLPKILGQRDEKCIMSHASATPGLTDCRQDPKDKRKRRARWAQAGKRSRR